MLWPGEGGRAGASGEAVPTGFLKTGGGGIFRKKAVGWSWGLLGLLGLGVVPSHVRERELAGRGLGGF